MKNYHSEIGIIGGTGIYNAELLDNSKSIKIFTPYGSTSDLITIGEYEGRSVAFIPVMVKDIPYLHTRSIVEPIFGLFIH